MTQKGQAETRARRRPRVLGDRRALRHHRARPAAPALAEVALNFSSFEYFWLVLLGLTCAVFIAVGDPLKGVVSLLSAC